MKIIINEGTSFLITDEPGDIKEETEEGLFHQDTRFLSGYKLLINGQKPILLSSRQINYFTAHHYLSNPPFKDIPGNALSITRFRFVGDGLHEDIDVYNHHAKEISCFLQLRFRADFADIFEVKTSGVIKKGIFSFLIGEDKRSLSFIYKRENFIRKL
jgi:glycogen debranching enzyme